MIVDPLVDKARNGSSEAFGCLWQLHSKRLLRVAKRILPPLLWTKVDADDLMQDTFLNAWRRFYRFGGTQAEVWFYLKICLRYTSRRLLQRFRISVRDVAREFSINASSKRFGTSLELCDDSLSPSDIATNHEQIEIVKSAIDLLSVRGRQIIVGIYYNELTFEELGSQLAISHTRVGQLLPRFIYQLRQNIYRLCHNILVQGWTNTDLHMLLINSSLIASGVSGLNYDLTKVREYMNNNGLIAPIQCDQHQSLEDTANNSCHNQICNIRPTRIQTLKEVVQEAEKQHIIQTLQALNMSRTETARALGIDRTNLYHKMIKYNILYM